MFIGAHMIINSTKPELDRAFLRDVFQLTHIDVGDGWLIFGLPPSEIGIHPSEENDVHELFFMCDNMDDFLKEMKKEEGSMRHCKKRWVGSFEPCEASRWWNIKDLRTTACAP